MRFVVTKICCALALLIGVAFNVRAEEPAAWADKNMDSLVTLYRHFHSHPELSFQEKETADRLAKELREAGYDVTEHVGGTGVVALLENGAGPTVMVRSDLDALPVTEQTGLAYASTVRVKNVDGTDTGVMHACGHDIHITNLVGVARYLATHRDRWSGTLMLIGQLAEERGNGARHMLKDGLFERFPKPEYSLAVHVDSRLEAGKIEYRAGYLLANVDSVDIILHGRGGHGASPHTTIDPVVMAAHLVLDLQSLVSRETNPVEPAVVTVGSIHGGTKHNIIGNDCHLQLTVRSYSDKVRKHLLDGIRRKAAAVAASAGAPEPEVKMSDDYTPALLNDAKLVERLLPTLKKTLGDENIREGEMSMGGEDFSLYGRAGSAICMLRLGSVEAKRLAGLKRGGMEPPSLHSPIYFPDAPETLKTGIAAMCACVVELMPVRK